MINAGRGGWDNAGRVMTDKQVRDEAMTILLAGHETTANALTWTVSDQPVAGSRGEAAREVDRCCRDGCRGGGSAWRCRSPKRSSLAMAVPPAWIVGRRARRIPDRRARGAAADDHDHEPAYHSPRRALRGSRPLQSDPDGGLRYAAAVRTSCSAAGRAAASANRSRGWNSSWSSRPSPSVGSSRWCPVSRSSRSRSSRCGPSTA